MAQRFIKGAIGPSGIPPVRVVNTVAYTGANSMYDDAAAGLFKHERLGLRVTLSLPPNLRAFRYPALTAGASGTPVITAEDNRRVIERAKWFREARKSNAADIVARKVLRKKLANNQAALDTWEAALKKHPNSANAKAKVKLYTKRVNDITKAIATINRRLNRVKVYTTNFDITHFVTSLSWSSSDENAKISMEIGLDNTQGLFNYLPTGAKITLHRKKSLNNLQNTTGTKWYPYIVAYVTSKSIEAAGRTHTMSLTCQDRMSRLDRQMPKKNVYKTDTNHKKGWSPREITLDICKREGIPVNKGNKLNVTQGGDSFGKILAVPKTVISFKKVKGKKGTGKKYHTVTLPRLPKYDPGESDDRNSGTMINDCWKYSVDEIPKKFGIPYPMFHMRTGSLEVEFLAPPTTMTIQAQKQIVMFNENNIESMKFTESLSDEIVGTDQIIGATDQDKQKTYTELRAKGSYYVMKRVGKGKKKKKVKKTETALFAPKNKEMIWAAYGRITSEYTFKKRTFASRAAFRAAAQAMVDRAIEPRRSLEMTAKAPLGLWPNRYVHINSRLFGIRGYFPITSVNYTVQNGVISCSMTLSIKQKQVEAGQRHFSNNSGGQLMHTNINEGLKFY